MGGLLELFKGRRSKPTVKIPRAAAGVGSAGGGTPTILSAAGMIVVRSRFQDFVYPGRLTLEQVRRLAEKLGFKSAVLQREDGSIVDRLPIEAGPGERILLYIKEIQVAAWGW